MDMQTRGVTITFSDFFWRILASWKLILILLMVGAIISVLYVANNYNSKQDAYLLEKNEYDRVMAEYEEEKKLVLAFNIASPEEKRQIAAEMADRWQKKLSYEQNAVVDNALSIKKLIEDNDSYQKKSILMRIDPYHVNTLYMVFEVNSESVNPLNVLNSYASYILSDEVIKEIASQTKWNIDENGISIYSELFTNTIQNGNQLCITVQSSLDEDLNALAETIQKVLLEKKGIIEKSIGKHSFFLLTKSVSEKVNNAIAITQNTIQNQIVGYNNQLIALKNTMKIVPEQNNLYILKSGIEFENEHFLDLTLPNEPDVKKPAGLKSKVTYLALGILIGLIVGIVIVYVKMIFTSRIQKTEELKSIYGIPIAGFVYKTRRLAIDSKIVRFQKGKKAPRNNENALSLLSSDIADICKTKNINRTSIIGTSICEKDFDTIKKLLMLLKDKGIEIVGFGDILSDDNSRSTILEPDAYVLVETLGKAKFKDIDSEKQLLDSMGKQPICAFGIE